MSNTVNDLTYFYVGHISSRLVYVYVHFLYKFGKNVLVPN